MLQENKEHKVSSSFFIIVLDVRCSKYQRNDHRHLLCLWTNIASSFLDASGTSTQ